MRKVQIIIIVQIKGHLSRYPPNQTEESIHITLNGLDSDKVLLFSWIDAKAGQKASNSLERRAAMTGKPMHFMHIIYTAAGSLHSVEMKEHKAWHLCVIPMSC